MFFSVKCEGVMCLVGEINDLIYLKYFASCLAHCDYSVKLIYFLNWIFFFLPCSEACGVLVPQPEIKPMTPELGIQSLNRWTAWEVP